MINYPRVAEYAPSGHEKPRGDDGTTDIELCRTDDQAKVKALRSASGATA